MKRNKRISDRKRKFELNVFNNDGQLGKKESIFVVIKNEKNWEFMKESLIK